MSVLVTTNGEKTEMEYLKALVRESWVHARIRKPKVQFMNAGPEELVRKTARTRHRIGFDQAYAVADADHFDVAEAQRVAEEADIPLLVSTPSFEAWLVLHFEDCRQHLADGRAAVERLRRHVPGYEKDKLRFADFAEHVESATERARATGARANPSSELWKLVDGLRDPSDGDMNG